MSGYPQPAIAKGPAVVNRFAAATSDAIRLRVIGDTADRFIVDADGQLTWQSGSGLGAVVLGRSAANVLRLQDKLLVDLELEVDGALNHDGSTVGFYGKAPVAQAAHIPDPSGGLTQDAAARTAINAILVVLEGVGLTAAS